MEECQNRQVEALQAQNPLAFPRQTVSSPCCKNKSFLLVSCVPTTLWWALIGEHQVKVDQASVEWGGMEIWERGLEWGQGELKRIMQDK